ncbi:MAG: hypothetical protein VW378_07000 [bacterium]
MNPSLAFATDPSVFEEHPQHKKIKEEIKAKQQALLKQKERVSDTKTIEQGVQAFQVAQKEKELFEDRVDLSLQDHVSEETVSVKDPDRKFFQQDTLWRLIGYDTRPEQRKEQLTQDYLDTLKQYYSHNDFLSDFAGFKSTVLNKMLHFSGLNNQDLAALKQQAKQDVFEENIHLMAENIYNLELAELLYGKKKLTRPVRAKMMLLQQKLLQQMQKLDGGYWTKSRLLEEKITQSKKIRDEFEDECKNIEYFIGNLWEGNAGHHVNIKEDGSYL